jgi:glutathione S-transferase
LTSVDYVDINVKDQAVLARMEGIGMRFMLQVGADRDTEAGVLPTTELLAAMGRFNEAMIAAGILPAGEGLQPSSKGVRISFAGAEPSVIEPPFAEPNELIAGFWMIEIKSKEAAIDWAMRAPFDTGANEIARCSRRRISRLRSKASGEEQQCRP